MANMEEFVFSVDAEVGQAVAKLDQVRKLMDNITRLRNKGIDDYRTTNQKDMDKNMRSMKQLTYLYNQMNKDLEGLQTKLRDTSESMGVPEGATDKQRRDIDQLKGAMEQYANDIVRQQLDIQSAYTDTLLKFKEMAKFQQNYSKNFKHIFSSKDVYNMPNKPEDWDRARQTMKSMASDADGVSSKLEKVVGQIKDVNKLERRTESMSRRAHASQYMSHQQASSFRQDYNTVNTDYIQRRERNLDTLTKMGQERTRLWESQKKIESNPTATQDDIDRKILIQQTIESMDKEMEARMELNRVLERTISNMTRYNADVQGVELKPERGTWRGMMYERAPAIGLAMGGAFGGSIGGLYHQGASISKGLRDDEITIGQRTDTAGSKWRDGIRNGAIEAGLKDKLGFSGQEMMTFQNNYLSNNGYKGMGDLNTAMQNQAVFSRVSGVNAADTNQLFSTLFQTGAVNGNQVKDIQNAFIGAIKMSGMEGREKEQLQALDGILQGVARGRTLSNQDVMNTLGLQSILANSGQRSLQGSQGAELMNGLNEGIRGGFNDPTIRLLFGQGTKYQGVAGRFALRSQMDKGISDIGNVETMARYAQSYGNDKDVQNEAFASLAQKMGVNITGEQSKAMMDLFRQGKLNQDNLNKVLKENGSTGKSTADKRLKEYQSSSAAIDNQSDAVTQKMAAELYDLGEVLRKTNASLNVLPPALYALTIAVGSLAATMIASGSMFALSRGVRNFSAGTFSTQGGRGTGLFGRLFNRGGRPPTGGGGVPPVTPSAGGGYTTPGGIWVPNQPAGGGGSSTNTRTYSRGGWFGPRNGSLPNPGPSTQSSGNWFTRMFKGGGGTAAVQGAEAASSGGGILAGAGKALKGAGKVLGKIALPLSIGLGIMDVMNAPKGKKGEATGKATGGILGGIFGGMAAGAAAGSIIPGAGTLVGAGIGLIGGIGGAILGSKAGGGIGSWFDPKKAEASADEDAIKANMADVQKDQAKKTNSTKEQTDKENTNTKQRTENKKGSNLSYERENLSMYSKLLDRAAQLLSQARSQGGFFGASGNVGTGQGTGGQAPSAGGNGNASKIWNFFQGKGMSSGAIAGIMGNLQQESGLDPNAPGGGLAQWIGSRQKDLQSFAKKGGMDPNSLDTQLQFMWKEMSSGSYGDMSKMNGMSAKDAAQWFEEHYEKAGKPMMEKRKNYADNFYNQYGTNTQWSNTGSNKSAAASNNVKVSSTITVNVKGDENVADKVKNSKEMKTVAQQIHNSIYGAMNFYSKEMKLT